MHVYTYVVVKFFLWCNLFLYWFIIFQTNTIFLELVQLVYFFSFEVFTVVIHF